jgi:two-component system chemotaxis response regulator CheY
VKVLVVDDSKVMRMIVRRTLRQAGIECVITEAEDGKDAIAKMNESMPELILCDWNMPNMNGIELLRAVRKAGYRMPFGFVTTEGTPEMRAQARDAGAQFLIAKPFKPEDFSGAIRELKSAA